MDREGLKHLQDRFRAGIAQSEEMIANIKRYRLEGENSFDEGIAIQTRAIENYTQSIAFIDRYLTDPHAKE